MLYSCQDAHGHTPDHRVCTLWSPNASKNKSSLPIFLQMLRGGSLAKNHASAEQDPDTPNTRVAVRGGMYEQDKEVELMSDARGTRRLTTETVQGAALALEGIDDVERGNGLALRVLSVGDSITDDTLKESLQNTTGLFVDHG